MDERRDPGASRPHMPGYGIVGVSEGTGLLPWSWAAERLARSHDYWLATVGAAGRPHVMPVWGVWDGEAVWVSSSGESRKTRNLSADPRCTVTTDDPYHPVIVEGRAARVYGEEEVRRFTEQVNVKYAVDYSVEFFATNACFAIRPDRVFGLTEDDFTGSPTRWTFTAPT